MGRPLYDILIVLHVASAVAGFGALALTGWNAGPRGASEQQLERLRRFFRPGRNWPARSILLVPLFGGALLAAGHGQDVGKAFPWIGLGLWTVAASIASAAVWPDERRLQQLVAAGQAQQAGPLRARIRAAALATSVLFLAAAVVMIVQPA